MSQPTMSDAYAKAVQIIGDQAVQLALAADEIARLRALVPAEPEPDSAPDR